AGGAAMNGIDYGLTTAQVGDGAGFPQGLPRPMAVKNQPWTVKPTKFKRLDSDFDPKLGSTRTDILSRLDPAGDYGRDGFQGVFFYDDATGTAHTFASLSWTVIYDPSGATHISIPVREVETRTRFNDPSHPNCVGAYRADAIDPATCQQGSDAL